VSPLRGDEDRDRERRVLERLLLAGEAGAGSSV
jgi:hypothetical protein